MKVSATTYSLYGKRSSMRHIANRILFSRVRYFIHSLRTYVCEPSFWSCIYLYCYFLANIDYECVGREYLMTNYTIHKVDPPSQTTLTSTYSHTMLYMPGQSGSPVVSCCNSQWVGCSGQWPPDTRMRPLLPERGEQLQQVC